MKTSRRFSRGVLNHVYQRTVHGFVIFYCVSDYLVYFTTMCTIAARYRVRILMVSLMPDHIHLSVIAATIGDLSGFMHELSRLFALRHNVVCHRRGSLFERPFGSAPKYGDKKVRSNIIYVGNNGPERHLSKKAEDYRWNFLAYSNSDHPFSEELVIRHSSSYMKKALREVRAAKALGMPLSYIQLKRLFRPLDRIEKEQLTDYIITLYDVIDHAEAIKYFGSYEDMLRAMHSSTGSEYDINEVVIGKSDIHYARMVSVCMNDLGLNDIHDILALDTDAKMRLFHLLSAKTDALPEQIAAFLRMPLQKA